MSTAILELSENGELQQIHDLWLSGYGCSAKVQVQSNELNLRSFWGLFLITGVASVFCVICYIIRMIWQYNKRTAAEPPPIHHEGHDDQRIASRFLRGASFLKSLASFIEEAETTEGEARNSKRDSNRSRSSKDRSPVDSTRMSMSEKSIESSTRNSMVSADDSREELRELLKELSMTFKAANNKRIEEDIALAGKIEDEEGMQELRTGKKDNPLPPVSKRLNTFKSFIFRPQINKITEEGSSTTPTGGEELEDDVLQHASSLVNVAGRGTCRSLTLRRPMERRSTTFKSILFKSGSGKRREEDGSTSRGKVECAPIISSVEQEEGTSSMNESSRVPREESPAVMMEVKRTHSSLVSTPVQNEQGNVVQNSMHVAVSNSSVKEDGTESIVESSSIDDLKEEND